MPIDLNQKIQEFGDNADRVDQWVNDPVGYTDKNGNPVDSIPKLIGDLNVGAQATAVFQARDEVEADKEAVILAKVAAETAADSAFTNADVYADTAAGIAATFDGDQFLVVVGDEIVRYENDSGVAVPIPGARYPASSVVNDLRFIEATIGQTAASITEQANLSSATIVFANELERDGRIKTVRADCNVTGTLAVRIFERSGDVFTQVGSDTIVNLTAGGIRTVALADPIEIEAGQYIGFYASANGVITFLASAPTPTIYYSGTGNVTSFTDTGPTATQSVQVGFDVDYFGLSASDLVDLDDRVETVEAVAATITQRVGLQITPVTGSGFSDQWAVFADPVANDGMVESIRLFSLGNRPLFVGIWERNGITLTRVLKVVIEVRAGDGTYPLNIPIKKGQYLGVHHGRPGTSISNLAFLNVTSTMSTAIFSSGNGSGDVSTFNAVNASYNLAIQASFDVQVLDETEALNMQNSDRITVFADSYTQSDYTLPSKAWISLVSQVTGQLWENHGSSGQTMSSRISNSGTSPYGNIPPFAVPNSYLMSYIGENDDNIQTLPVFRTNMERFCQLARGVGAKPLLVQQHTDTFSGAAQALVKELVDKYDGAYGSVRANAYVNQFGANATGLWNGNHPGTRSAYLLSDQIERIVNSLPRARQSMKLFRKRSTVSVSTVADLKFVTRDQRLKLFNEILIGQSGLKEINFGKYDEINTISFATDSEIRTSEYQTLIGGGTVSIDDYALIEMLLPSQGILRGWLNIGVSGVTAYFYDRQADAWAQITGDGNGLYPITRTVLNRGLYDNGVLPILLFKSGGAWTIPEPKLTWAGDEKPWPATPRTTLERAKGSELLTQTLIGTSGELADWTTTGTVTVEGSPVQPPRGSTSYVTVSDANTIAQSVAIASNVDQDREVEIMVRARRYPTRFVSSTDTFPDDSEIKLDSYDERDLVLTLTIGGVETLLNVRCGLWWKDCLVRTVIGAGQTSFTMKIAAESGAEIQVAAASVKNLY